MFIIGVFIKGHAKVALIIGERFIGLLLKGVSRTARLQYKAVYIRKSL